MTPIINPPPLCLGVWVYVLWLVISKDGAMHYGQTFLLWSYWFKKCCSKGLLHPDQRCPDVFKDQCLWLSYFRSILFNLRMVFDSTTFVLALGEFQTGQSDVVFLRCLRIVVCNSCSLTREAEEVNEAIRSMLVMLITVIVHCFTLLPSHCWPIKRNPLKDK